ncbi:hypothetical protein FRC04_002634 [Tulasnella sp. 424]|nr:hypothetical protein FRC04_002634 [Tulasnella sp. 424]
MMHPYKPKDVSTCFPGRRIVFAGDSVTRSLFFAFAHLSDPSLPSEPPKDDYQKKHADHNLHSPEGDINFDFYWDPFLNSTRIKSMLHGDQTQGEKPALLVLGSGLWYLRYPQDSGGLAGWEGMVDQTFAAIPQALPGLADRVVVLPVEEPVISKLSPERAATIHLGDVDAMNSDLMHRVSRMSKGTSMWGPTPLPTYPIAIPTILNKMLLEDQTQDGLHFSSFVLSQQANVLYNFRCNEALPKYYPFDKTCCNSYPQTPFVQLFILVLILAIGPFVRFVGPHLVAYKPTIAGFLPGNDYLIPLTIFGGVVGLNFLADRTAIWMKEQKQFDPWVFTGLCVLSMVAGLATMKGKDKDMGLLNRDQTDEWKGWMQLAILIYHYLGASKISGIYNPIRVLVASYLWMTGYGHFHFYYKKADYGMLRIAQVMVRINALTIILAYVMDTDYVFYYFAPLVSFWFVIIYGTMYIGHKYNENTGFMFGKILASAAVLTYVFKSQWLIEFLFGILNRFFAIRWEAREWMFRVTLDLWIPYVGMLTALAYIKAQQLNLTDHPRFPMALRTTIGASVAGLVWFFWFELRQPDKFVYNGWHPYISWIPVLSFIVLRNCTPYLRSVNSRAFAFVGRCSLETFIMQYHFWLAADTRGILMVLPLGTAWRTLNMIVSTIGFIYVCHHVAEATGWITNWVCGTPRKARIPPPAVQNTQANGRTEEAIPLLPADQIGAPKANGSSKTVVFDAEAANGGPSEPGSASGTGGQTVVAPRPNGDVPQSPAGRPRWLERLAERPGSPGPGWSPYIATRNRVFGAWEEAAAQNPGLNLTVKGTCILVVLWILNLVWPS